MRHRAVAMISTRSRSDFGRGQSIGRVFVDRSLTADAGFRVKDDGLGGYEVA